MLIKGILLFLSILTVLPLVFFFLIATFSGAFYFEVDKTSWIARTPNKWVRAIADRFFT